MRTMTLALLLGLTLACEGGDEETGTSDSGSDTSDTDSDTSDTDTSDTDTSDTDTSEPSCDAVAAADCDTTSGCSAIRGREVTEDDCIDYTADSEPFGCMQEDLGCGDAETWAKPSEGDACVLFSNTCIPSGWITCDFQDTPECVIK